MILKGRVYTISLDDLAKAYKIPNKGGRISRKADLKQVDGFVNIKKKRVEVENSKEESNTKKKKVQSSTLLESASSQKNKISSCT